jgi:hypothetical protein
MTARPGGLGGDFGGNNSVTSVYGSMIAPTTLGSSGTIADGGGAIQITVNGTSTINGTINVDGSNSTGTQGGAGGSI